MTFSAASTLDKEHIETRVVDVLKSFEKVHPEKVRSELDPYVFTLIACFQIKSSASFTNDLGLDSLDAVEVVMAVEEVCFNVVNQLYCCLKITRFVSVGVLYRDSRRRGGWDSYGAAWQVPSFVSVIV